MLKQRVLDDELASLINQGRLIVEQFKKRAVTLSEARQFLNELCDRDEYGRLSKASAEKMAVDAEIKNLNDELVKLALANRRQI
ncbi:MAG: hypothetical protein AAB584_02685 [Patescibacteria group bacterium]